MTVMQLLLLACAPLWVAVDSNLDADHPIIYRIPHNNTRNSYFGFSVAIRPKAASLPNSWAIQIGAPRDNIDGMNVREPGTVYRCHTYGPCQMFLLDKAVDETQGKGVYKYRDKKDEAWIGASMDIKDFDSREKSIVCGHRWINQNLKNPENIDVTYLMTGVCYLQDLFEEAPRSPAHKLLPLVNADKIYTPKPYVPDLSTYHWGLGQAGISAKLVGEPPNVVIGAPGVTHWTGSVVRYGPNFNMTVGNFVKTEVSSKNRYTYLGYSVAAGKFYSDKKLWFVAGAPRSANYHGQVFTFQYQDSTDNVYIMSTLTGSTFGEYFGSSLATSDINGDGADDLVVGAPLYSNGDPDEGRIYIYLGTTQGNFLSQSQVINGRIGRGRFGSCVASLNDLDQDGYDDVAVGAPYEDGQRGAVYVFKGCSLGLQTEPSQRFSAQDVYPYLRGFGISISSSMDVDGNKYGDVAVGSYLSEHVVLLRSRPVISLHPKIRADDVPLIDRGASSINISLCLSYTGSNAPHYADILRIIEIDPLHRRGSLRDPQTSFNKKLTRLRRNEILCEVLIIYLDLSLKDYSPLYLTMKSEFPSCTKTKGKPLLITSKRTEEEDGFLKWCPTGEKEETSKEIAFAGICGADHVCRSDLNLSCDVPEFRSGSYVLGSSEHLVLFMDIKNLGEPAQNTRIKIWSDIKLLKHEYGNINRPDASNTFWLDVEGTLTDNHQRTFAFRIPFEDIKMQKGLTLIAEVFTSSMEVNLNNNRCRFSIQLVSDAVVDLYSSSSLASFFISGESISEQHLNFTHFYEVQKTGKTPVKYAKLKIYIPFYFRKEFLSFEVETPDWMQHSARYEETTLVEEEVSPIQGNLTNTASKESNRTLFLNCSETDGKCHIVKIYFTNGIPTGLSSYVKILFDLNISAIDSIKDDKKIIQFSTLGVLRYRKYLEAQSEDISGSASVMLYAEERGAAVSGLVVGLSVLAGGFVFCAIVTCLARRNFFRRTKKEELDALREADASFVYFATGANPGVGETNVPQATKSANDDTHD